MVDIAQAVQEAGTVRKARLDEAGKLAAILARAFYDDPAMEWALVDDTRRLGLLQRSFDLYLRKLWFKQDQCYTTGSLAGAVVWELPGRWKLNTVEQLRMLPSMARIFGRLLPRVLRSLTALESNHPTAPHYYLPFVGVEPEWQGRGLGTALMRPVLDRCDDEKLGAYLEASSPRNRALYERHGFDVTEEFSLGAGSPPLWRMWRDPQG
jgi:GNAT superfamily N-acetyltransferase